MGTRIRAVLTPGGVLAPEDIAKARDAAAELAKLQEEVAAEEDEPEGEQAPGERDEGDAWPKGKAEPFGGWDPYLYGIDLVAELGLMRIHSRNVLLKAVMPGRKASKILRPDQANVRGAVCFEIVALAPDIPEEELHHPVLRPHGLKVGDEVLHLSASSDPVDPENPNCPWFFVALEDLAGSWDVRVLRNILEGSAGMNLDELKAHALRWLDDNAVPRSRPGIFARVWRALFGTGTEYVRADGSIRHARIQSRKLLPRDATTHYIARSHTGGDFGEP